MVTPPLTLAPVAGPTLDTELDAVDGEWILAVVVVAGFAAAPAVDDDKAAPFCNADIKLLLLTADEDTIIQMTLSIRHCSRNVSSRL